MTTQGPLKALRRLAGPILAAGALEPDEARPHGRGIALVRSLCASVLFTGTGNRVQARYLL